MMKIYGRMTSSNVQTVMWALAELELDVERIDIGGVFGGNNVPDYLALNPNGLVPTLQDGGLILFEANAIVRYLADSHHHGVNLWEEDKHQRALNDQWMEWSKTTAYKSIMSGMFMYLVRGPVVERSQQRTALLASELSKVMAIANNQLEKQKWLAGDKFSIADIAFGTLLFRYFEMDFARSDYPALSNYYEQLKLRTSYRENVMIDYSSLAAS